MAKRRKMAKVEISVHVRWMIRRDMPEVLDIEQGGFENPWVEEDLLHCLRQRNCIGMIAELGELVVGFMVYELQKNYLRLLDLAVAREWRRRTVGKQMVDRLISKLSNHRRPRIVAEIGESNLPGQLFFKRQGFVATRVLRKVFDDSDQDAYQMEYWLRAENEQRFSERGNRLADNEF